MSAFNPELEARYEAAGVPVPADAADARDRYRLARFGARVLEILALTELPAGFDAPDKIGAVRDAALELGLLGEEMRP